MKTHSVVITKEGEVCLHILNICQSGVDLPVWTILMSKETSNHILNWDVYPGCCQQIEQLPNSLTVRQGRNRLTFLVSIPFLSDNSRPPKDKRQIRKNKL